MVEGGELSLAATLIQALHPNPSLDPKPQPDRDESDLRRRLRLLFGRWRGTLLPLLLLRQRWRRHDEALRPAAAAEDRPPRAGGHRLHGDNRGATCTSLVEHSQQEPGTFMFTRRSMRRSEQQNRGTLSTFWAKSRVQRAQTEEEARQSA